ncbi:MAG: hypothetical protein ABIH51_01935 [Patescibacteria group bacterium]
MKTKKKFNSGGEFNIFEQEDGSLLKIPRFEKVWDILYGGKGRFRKKVKSDLDFLLEHFSDYLPETKIIELNNGWGIQQKRIQGKPFFANRRMTTYAQKFFEQAKKVRNKTNKSPDFFGILEVFTFFKRSGNLLIEEKTDKLFLVDICVLRSDKLWPLGNFISKVGSLMQWNSLFFLTSKQSKRVR